MNVLIINQYAYAPFHHGGTRHFMLARELQRHGHRALIVATSFFHKSQSETRLAPRQKRAEELIDDVRFLWLRTPPYRGNGPGRVRNMASFACQIARLELPADFHPDIVYSSSPQLLSSLAAQHLAKRLGLPHVFEIRDLWPQTFVDLGTWPSWHPWVQTLGLIQKRLYRHAAHVITTLPNAADYIIANGGRQEAVTWITNGIDVENLGAPSPQRREPRPFILMHAGVHARSTGLDHALDAAAILMSKGHGDDIRLVLLGDGPDKERHRRRAEREGLANVEFRDPVPKSEVQAHLAGADGFLLIRAPSPVHRWGISPHKLADYFAAGRPVVFCVDSSWNPVNTVGAGMTATCGCAASLADAITELASAGSVARQDMADRGREYLLQEMDTRILGQRLINVLTSVLARA